MLGIADEDGWVQILDSRKTGTRSLIKGMKRDIIIHCTLYWYRLRPYRLLSISCDRQTTTGLCNISRMVIGVIKSSIACSHMGWFWGGNCSNNKTLVSDWFPMCLFVM